MPGDALKIFAVDKKSTWHLHFVDYDSVELLNEAKTRIDEDIDEDNERYPFEG